jgi:hypothetical protein
MTRTEVPMKIITVHSPDPGRVDGHTSQWKQRYQAAILELDPAKLLQRIAEARSAVLDRIEDGFSKPSDGEQLAQRDALETLSTLRKIAECDTGEQTKTGTYWL